MSEKYTFDEICQLRQEVLKYEAYKRGGWYRKDEVSLTMVEDMVRTYMQSGVRISDIRSANEKTEAGFLETYGYLR